MRALLACIVAGLSLLPLACSSSEPDPLISGKAKSKADEPIVRIDELKEGTGEPAKLGDNLTVHYTGWLTDGTKFDSSLDRKEPFTVKRLGSGGVIPGWEKGLIGMKVGGKRKLTIPPELGYGRRGAGDKIPPNSVLIFEVELLKLE